MKILLWILAAILSSFLTYHFLKWAYSDMSLLQKTHEYSYSFTGMLMVGVFTIGTLTYAFFMTLFWIMNFFHKPK